MRVLEGAGGRSAGGGGQSAKSARKAAKGLDNGQFWGTVDERPTLTISGSTLTAAAGTAATTLTVADASDFNAEGGVLRIRLSETGDPDAAPLPDLLVTYTGWDGDYDDIPDDTLLLAEPLPTPLPTPAPVGCQIDVWDPTRDAPAQEWVMGVIADDSETGTSLPVTIDPGDVDGLPLTTFPGLGESVLVGPDNNGGDEDDLVLIRIRGAKLARDGNFTPMTVDAFARTLGQLGGIFKTAVIGARAEISGDTDGGFFRILNNLNEVVGIVQAKVEDGVQRFSIGTGGAIPVRLRFRNAIDERVIEALTDRFKVFGLLDAQQLTLQQSPTRINGYDGNAAVSRSLTSAGTTTFTHNLNGGGTVHAIARDDYTVSVVSVTGSEITLRFRNPDGSLAGNATVTFDWSITSYIR